MTDLRLAEPTAAEQSRRLWDVPDTPRVIDLRMRVRDAMERTPQAWSCPSAIDSTFMTEPIAVRKARAIALKLSQMPVEQWDGQLIAGSTTLEDPRLHAEGGFPDYLTAAERADAQRRGLSIGCFGHIVPDYPRLLDSGLSGIQEQAHERKPSAANESEMAFLNSVEIAIDGVLLLAKRIRGACEDEAGRLEMAGSSGRARELRNMVSNLESVPAGPARSFWQALQSVWLLHMGFHSTLNGNAVGRLDQYAWPFLEDDLRKGRIDIAGAAELIDCFTLKFNERAKTTEDQHNDRRSVEPLDPGQRTRHTTSSQIGRTRDRIDATNHWLQNIIVSGLTPEGADGSNLLSHLLLRSFGRNQMTNPLVTIRLHRDTPDDIVHHGCEVLKNGGGMPAFFNDEVLVPALTSLDFPESDARDYTNDGCWEVIIPGRTDFMFQRLSLMLCLEWALNGGKSRQTGQLDGIDTGDPRSFSSFEDIWNAFCAQLDAMVARTVDRVVASQDQRSEFAPVPLLSALIDGAIEARRDMTAGGARYRTYGMLAESAAHAIDSLTAMKSVTSEGSAIPISEICDALDADFQGHEALRQRLLEVPKYGNDDPVADDMGRQVIGEFTRTVQHRCETKQGAMRFPCGVGTFSWYIGIGEGLGSSPDGRKSGQPVSSNFSPALGVDMNGVPSAILSYGGMPHKELPAGGPLDLRVSGKLVEGEDGTHRLAALVRGFVESGGSMMTITVADSEELKAAQNDPHAHRSLRVRMGGWCAYFVALSREQQDHQIRRQEGGT